MQRVLCIILKKVLSGNRWLISYNGKNLSLYNIKHLKQKFMIKLVPMNKISLSLAACAWNCVCLHGSIYCLYFRSGFFFHLFHLEYFLMPSLPFWTTVRILEIRQMTLHSLITVIPHCVFCQCLPCETITVITLWDNSCLWGFLSSDCRWILFFWGFF